MALQIKDPTLMILKTKHYPSYYLLRNVNDYIKVLTRVAEERLKADYWYEKTKDQQDDLFSNNMSPHELITNILKLDRDHPNFRRDLHHFMQDRMREGYEYEGWEFEQFKKIEE